MADNVPITAGTGTSIATDDCGGGGHAQVAKLAISADADRTLIPADAANGLDVDVTRVSGNVTVVQGTATNLKVDASGVAVPVTDNSGSLTVDAPVGTPLATRLSDGAAFLTTTSGRLSVDASAVAVPVTDNAGSLTVDGTVTATLAANVTEDAASAGGETAVLVAGVRNDSATSKTSTDGDFGNLAIDAAGRVGVCDLGGAVSVDDNGSTLSIDDGGGNISIDDGGNSITVDNGGTFAVQASCTNAGTFAVQATCTNAGTFAVQIDSGAVTSLALIDDAVHADDAARGKSLLMGAVLDDTSTVAITENQAGYLRMSTRRALLVEGVAGGTAIPVSLSTIAVTNTGTFAVQAACTNAGTFAVQATCTNAGTFAVQAVCTNVGTFAVQATIAAGAAAIAKAEDVASADADVGVPAMAVRKATPANTSGTDGDYEMLQMSAGRLWVDASGKTLTVDGSGVTQPVSGTVAFSNSTIAVTNAGTFAVQIAANSSVNVAQLAGTTTDTNSGTKSAGTLRVVLATDQPALTNALKVDGSAVTQPVSGTITASNTAGDVAHDGADSGNPVKVGGKAANAFPTAVSNNDRANFLTDLFGRMLTSHIDPAQQIWKSANYTSTQTGAAIWTPASGKKIAVTSIVVGTYGTTAARLILWFGASGDSTYTAGTDQLVLAMSAAPSATSKPGMVFTPPVPVFCLTADYILRITTDAGLSVDVAVYGYEF